MTPLLSVENLSKLYGARVGCAGTSLDLWSGEVLAIVGNLVPARQRYSNASPAKWSPPPEWCVTPLATADSWPLMP